jgi:hypothetical protein
MTTETAGTDRGVGLGVLFGVVAGIGAVGMVAAPGQLAKAAGFTLALVGALLSVVASQAYT